MGTNKQITDALGSQLEPGEKVIASRPVVANAKIEDGTFETTLALLGPSVFVAAGAAAIVGGGTLPERTNLVVVTDRRVLWCTKGRLSSEIEIGGSDPLGAVHRVEVVAARIALAKLRFKFHDRSVVQFDLPSDHKAEEFIEAVTELLGPVQSAA